jgi:hypothetical protein
MQEEVAETTASPHASVFSRIKDAIALGDWHSWEAWKAWLAAKVPDTAKEVWEWTVMALLLAFAVSLVNSIARVQWQIEGCPDTGRR